MSPRASGSGSSVPLPPASGAPSAVVDPWELAAAGSRAGSSGPTQASPQLGAGPQGGAPLQAPVAAGGGACRFFPRGASGVPVRRLLVLLPGGALDLGLFRLVTVSCLLLVALVASLPNPKSPTPSSLALHAIAPAISNRVVKTPLSASSAGKTVTLRWIFRIVSILLRLFIMAPVSLDVLSLLLIRESLRLLLSRLYPMLALFPSRLNASLPRPFSMSLSYGMRVDGIGRFVNSLSSILLRLSPLKRASG